MTLLKNGIDKITAFAPATSANLGVGFDIMGLALNAVGDKVTLKKRGDGKIVIDKINSASGLPMDAGQNTASYSVQKMCEDLKIECGFSLEIDKGIAIGSGMGGSAASAVAGVVALNGFLVNPVSKEKLVEYALYGEELASGGRHADNVAPCVFGGITLIHSIEPMEIIKLPYPQFYCVVIHPHLKVETKSARGILSNTVSLKKYINQSAHLSSTICALYTQDYGLFSRAMQDIIIEPQRSQLVTGFHEVKAAALANGALSATLSGSGPSMLAFCRDQDSANLVSNAMLETFKEQGVEADSLISEINQDGAYLIK